MLSYRIKGDNYDTIVVDKDSVSGILHTKQFYMYLGSTVKVSDIKYYLENLDGKITLVKIVTEDTDTVILPKESIDQLGAYSLTGVKFKRLIVPLGAKLHMCPKALYGSESVDSFVSLSRDLTYDNDVFPSSIKWRTF